MKKKVVLGKGVYFIIDENGVIETNEKYVMKHNDLHIKSFRVNIPHLMVKLFDYKYDESNDFQFMTRIKVVNDKAVYPYALDNLSYKIVNFNLDDFRRFRKTSIWIDKYGNAVDLEKKVAFTMTWNRVKEQWYIRQYSVKNMIAESFIPNELNCSYVWCPQSFTQKPKINLIKWCTKDEYAYYKNEYEKTEQEKYEIKECENIHEKQEKHRHIFSQRELRQYVLTNDKEIKNCKNIYISNIRIYKEFMEDIYTEEDLSLNKIVYNKHEYTNLNDLVYSPKFDLYYDPLNQNIIDVKDHWLYNLKRYEIILSNSKKLNKKDFVASLDFKGMDFEKSIFSGYIEGKYKTNILYIASSEGIELIYNSNNRTEKSENYIHRMCCIDWIKRNDKNIPKDKDIYFSSIKKIDENEPWVFSNMSYTWREKPEVVKNLGGPYKIDSEGYVYLKSNMMVNKLPEGIKTVKLGRNVYKVPSFEDIYIPTTKDKSWKPYYENKEVICYVSKDGRVRNTLGKEITLSSKNGRDDYVKITPSIHRTLPTLMSCWHPLYDKYSYIPPSNQFIVKGENTFENLKNKYVFSPSKRQDDNKILVPVNPGTNTNTTWYYFPSDNIFVSITTQGRRTVLSNLTVYNFLGAERYYKFTGTKATPVLSLYGDFYK